MREANAFASSYYTIANKVIYATTLSQIDMYTYMRTAVEPIAQ
jgi:hypothetical protein